MLEAIASRLEAIATRFHAIAIRLDVVAMRLKAITIGVGFHWKTYAQEPPVKRSVHKKRSHQSAKSYKTLMTSNVSNPDKPTWQSRTGAGRESGDEEEPRCRRAARQCPATRAQMCKDCHHHVLQFDLGAITSKLWRLKDSINANC